MFYGSVHHVAFVVNSGVHEVCWGCSKTSWPCESPAKQHILLHWSDTGQLWGAVLSRNCESLTFLIVSQQSYFSWSQADYYEGWGLHGRFILVESAVMDCLSEDKGLVAVREGYDRYRGDSQLQSWRKMCEMYRNQSSGDGIYRSMHISGLPSSQFGQVVEESTRDWSCSEWLVFDLAPTWSFHRFAFEYSRFFPQQ